MKDGIDENEYSRSSNGSTNFACSHIPSYALTCLPQNEQIQHELIFDIGASDHMKPFCDLFCQTRALKRSILVTSPNGSTKSISTVRKIKILPLTRYHVLYVPEFKYNLLSMSKLFSTQKLIAHFFVDH